IGDSILSMSFTAPDIIRKVAYGNYLKGIRSYNNKKYEAAAKFFTSALENKSTQKKIYYYRGESFLLSGHFEKAISDFLTDEKYMPGRSSYNLAKAYCLNKNFDKSIE